MSRFAVIIILLTFFNIPSNAQSKVCIKGYVTSTEDYCGGARPSDEMLQDLSTPKPFANKVIYVKMGTVNKNSNKTVKKLTTDANGRFSVMLSPGNTYYFIEEWKAKVFVTPKNTRELVWDIPCLRKRYASPDFVIKLKKGANPEVQINYHQNCSHNPYCGQFSGPLPP